MLESAGHTVLAGATGEEALEIIAREAAAIPLLITDVVMPGLSGPDLARACGRLHPEMRVLYVSGYTGDAVLRFGMVDEDVAFLPKPFTRGELVHKVREMLSSPGPSIPGYAAGEVCAFSRPCLFSHSAGSSSCR